MIILAATVADGSKAAGLVATVMLFVSQILRNDCFDSLLTCVKVFNGFFSVGMLAIPWLLPAEYAPLAIRTKAAALAAASNWIFVSRYIQAGNTGRIKLITQRPS